MNRQTVINCAVFGVMSYAGSVLVQHKHYGLAVVVFIAWIVGMINSMEN